MPIFQADLDQDPEPASDPEPVTFNHPPTYLRRLSEESLRTELCEGPLPDSPPPTRSQPSKTPPPQHDAASPISDRADLIQRLKQAQGPPWLSSHRVRSNPLQWPMKATNADSKTQLESFLQDQDTFDRPEQPKTPNPSVSSSLLPAPEITPEKDLSGANTLDTRLQDGLSLHRPGSALHSGDFTHDEIRSRLIVDSPRPSTRLPRQHTWLAASPPRDYTPYVVERRRRTVQDFDDLKPVPSSLSSSVSSSFIYKAPTSPLVQSETTDGFNFPASLDYLDRMNSRRHTLHAARGSPFASPSTRPSLPPRAPLHRREGSLPYQAHQPRRSLSHVPSYGQPGFGPQSPASLLSRRQSFGSDSSPLHHASMVGSYEESILRGRMSTNPSKPLDFLAQIGVLGMGKCKSSLRCPPHVTLPFPAVYYSYNSTAHGRSRAEDGPSPYVGEIDLENGLSNSAEDSRLRRKTHSRQSEKVLPNRQEDSTMRDGPDDTAKVYKSARRSAISKAPPGGSYRIPEKGQLQIIIKNQNKTAVKLFLIPYDLAGMDPGTKTFIRQRSYSAGPIMDDVPMASSLDSQDRPILRYLVHLHICSPSKGRFYLYKSIRVVFANRVPDGKEKLRNDITWPEPRFTPYKHTRLMHPHTNHVTGPGATLAEDTAFRRRSSGFPLGAGPHTFHSPAGDYPPISLPRAASTGSASGVALPVEPIPFRLPSRGGMESDSSDATGNTGARLRSIGSPTSRPSTTESNAGPAHRDEPTRYEKLNKGDLGYGGNAFAFTGDRSAGGAEGLLSRRLRTVGLGLPAPDLELGDEL